MNSNGKKPFSALSRSATRSGPAWLGREPARKKQPCTTAPLLSVRVACVRRFSIRNSDTSMRDIGPRRRSRYIFQSGDTLMGFTPTETIWFNGKLVHWNEAKVHGLDHRLEHGT